jgi:hypothetical protein
MSDDRRTITFWLPGRVIDAIRDGNWPNDNPPGWADIHDARYEGRGRGYRKYVRTSRANANDLADYLFSLADNVPINTDDGWDDGTRVILRLPRADHHPRREIGDAPWATGPVAPGGAVVVRVARVGCRT